MGGASCGRVKPKPTSRPLLLGHFKPLTAPDPLHPIAADVPPGFVQQCLDPAIAVPAVLRCQRDNGLRQRIFISTDNGGVTLRSAGLTDDPAGMTLRETKLPPNAFNGLPAPFGAYKFPEAISLSTCFSSDRSATRRFSSHLFNVGDVASNRVRRDQVFFAGVSINLVAIEL